MWIDKIESLVMRGDLWLEWVNSQEVNLENTQPSRKKQVTLNMVTGSITRDGHRLGGWGLSGSLRFLGLQ